MIMLSIRLYAWLSVVGGMSYGIFFDELTLIELLDAIAWSVAPLSVASSVWVTVLVFPAAMFAWLIPASTDALVIFGSLFALVVGALFLAASAGALIRVSSSPSSFWLGSQGAFDPDQ